MTNEEYEAERESILFDRERFPCSRVESCVCPRCRPDIAIATITKIAAESKRPINEHSLECKICGIEDCLFGANEAKRRYQHHLLKIMDAVDRGEAFAQIREKANAET